MVAGRIMDIGIGYRNTAASYMACDVAYGGTCSNNCATSVVDRAARAKGQQHGATRRGDWDPLCIVASLLRRVASSMATPAITPLCSDPSPHLTGSPPWNAPDRHNKRP